MAYAPDGGLERLTLSQQYNWIPGHPLDLRHPAGQRRQRHCPLRFAPRQDLSRAMTEAEPLGDGFDNTYERIEYSHNRQGQVVEMKDPNETVHQYLFDKLGRELQDIITVFGNDDLDQTVKRIETTYDTKRLLTVLVTSYDNDIVGMGVVVNQVEMVHNDFGQVIEDIQEHSGAVDVATPSVKYAHEDGSRANTARRTSMTYPDGRILNYTYGTDGEANDRLSRVGALQIEGEGFDTCTYTFVGAARYVKIAYPQPSVELTYFKPTTAPNGDAGDKYNGYDRFGRTVDMRWIKTPGASVRDRIQYGYDRANNRTWRKNLAATNKGKDNAYQYDGLYQVKQNAVGTLNTNQTAIGAIPGEQENFSYDPSGNWTNYQRAENGTEVLDQSRVNNQDNQVTQIDGSSDAIAYDKAGNATKLPPGADGDWSKHFQLKWDGWNRLVEIRDENGVLVAAYAYDGLFRRTTKVVGTETRSFYYNDLWKCVEERSAGGDVGMQYVWGARPNHRDELILRDRDTSGDGVLDERLYCLMDYYDPTSIVDTNGDVVERYRFSAFGIRTVFSATWTERSASSFEFDFGFHGQFLDEESGYYDYGYRYYSPELGRWLNRDPIAEDGGNNLYLTSLNQLINTNDTLGLTDFLLGFFGAGPHDNFPNIWLEHIFNSAGGNQQYLFDDGKWREAIRALLTELDTNQDRIICDEEIKGHKFRSLGFSWGGPTAIRVTRELNLGDGQEKKMVEGFELRTAIPFEKLVTIDPVYSLKLPLEAEANVGFWANYFQRRKKGELQLYDQNGDFLEKFRSSTIHQGRNWAGHADKNINVNERFKYTIVWQPLYPNSNSTIATGIGAMINHALLPWFLFREVVRDL